MVVRTPYVLAICLGFLSGVAIASFAYTASYIPGTAFIAATSIITIIIAAQWGGQHRAVACCFIIALGLGAARFAAPARASTAVPVPAGSDLRIEGRVSGATALTQGRRLLRLRDAQIIFPRVTNATGRAFRRPLIAYVPATGAAVSYGDTVRLACRFSPAERLSDRLTTDGTCSASRAADIEVLATGGGSPTLRFLEILRRDAASRMGRTLGDPAYGIVAGMVLGIPHAVKPDLEIAFRRSGTIHILVVSGWHMSFLALIIRRALISLGVHRRTTAKISIAAIAAFACMVGLTAPAVRGALVAIALLAVDLLGRVANPARILLLVAAVMVAMHPHILGFDIAFQLTVAATAAIILVAPIAEHAFPYRRRLLRELRDLIAASIAAGFATAPLLGTAFGAVSVIGPLAGIPILPTAEAVVVCGIALLAASAAVPPLVPVAVWVLTSLAEAIAWVVERTAAISWAQLPTDRFDGWFIAGAYLLAFFVILRWYRRHGVRMLSPFAFTLKQ